MFNTVIDLSHSSRKNLLFLVAINLFACIMFPVTLTQKIEDSNSSTSKMSSNGVNQNKNTVKKLSKTVPSAVVVQMPNTIQPLVINSSKSSPLPSTSSLFITPFRQSSSVRDSCVPNDVSYVNTISNVSSPSDRPVTHTYVSSIKSSQVK